MAQRLDLQALLLTLADNVYFQPPPSIQMKYPAIVYNRDRMDIKHADNQPYKNEKRYQITVIDADPDSNIPDKVAALPRVAFNRSFTSDNLHHDVFTIFF